MLPDGSVAVIKYIGPDLEDWFSKRSDFPIEPPRSGVWIWEGELRNVRIAHRVVLRLDGHFKTPTDDELVASRSGRDPWDVWRWVVPKNRKRRKPEKRR